MTLDSPYPRGMTPPCALCHSRDPPAHDASRALITMCLPSGVSGLLVFQKGQLRTTHANAHHLGHYHTKLRHAAVASLGAGGGTNKLCKHTGGDYQGSGPTPRPGHATSTGPHADVVHVTGPLYENHWL